MIQPYDPSLWRPATNGAFKGQFRWGVARYNGREWAEGPAGRTIRLASYESAERLASEMNYPSFLEHIRVFAGTRNWCVAARASGKTARYDVVITPKQYASEQTKWAMKHPAWLLADSLPDCEEKNFILKAVQSRLGFEG